MIIPIAIRNLYNYFLSNAVLSDRIEYKLGEGRCKYMGAQLGCNKPEGEASYQVELCYRQMYDIFPTETREQYDRYVDNTDQARFTFEDFSKVASFLQHFRSINEYSPEQVREYFCGYNEIVPDAFDNMPDCQKCIYGGLCAVRANCRPSEDMG